MSYPLNQSIGPEHSPLLAQQEVAGIKAASDEKWYLADSELHGTGIFAGKNYEAGEVVAVAATEGGNDEWGSKIWNLTTASRYCNHQSHTNVTIDQDGLGKFMLVTTKPVEEDKEFFANYRDITKKFGRRVRVLWDGVDIPTSDLEDFIELEKESEYQVAADLQGFIDRSELMGSRGRALKYGRPEPEGRDYDRVVFTDDAEDQQALMKNLREVAKIKGYKQHERPDGFLTISGDNQDLSVYPTSKRDKIYNAWELIEGGMSKDEAWDQIAKEDDVYVQSAVPAASRELVMKHGLLSSQALLDNPEALKAFLSDRKGTDWEEDEEAFKQRIGEKLKDTFWGDAVKGPSVFFGDPDPDKITDVHPMRKLKAETVRVNLSKLLRDYPKTRIAGTELQPYDPEGPEHQGHLRHYDIDMDKVREYAATDPKELWQHYDEPDGVRYASNVPHAQIITPSGGIPPEYLEFQQKEARDKAKFVHSCCGEPSGKCAGCSEGSVLLPKDEYEKAGDRSSRDKADS